MNLASSEALMITGEKNNLLLLHTVSRTLLKRHYLKYKVYKVILTNFLYCLVKNISIEKENTKN